MNDIIVLRQIADQATLYCNCVKKGYTELCYFQDPDQIVRVLLERPEVTVRNLTAGAASFYCENATGDQTGHIVIEISGVDRQTFYNNILYCNGLDPESYRTILQQLTEDDPVLQLYRLCRAEKKEPEPYETLLELFTEIYDVRQEYLNTAGDPDFIFREKTIASAYDVPYDFLPYRFDPGKNTWILSREQIVRNQPVFTFSGKPLEMYRILVLSEFQTVREYYIFPPSETRTGAILERKISVRKNLTEKTVGLMARMNLEEIAEDETGQEIVAALQEINPDHPLLQIPQVEYNENDNRFHAQVPDYDLVSQSDRTIYLAALEIDQAFSKTHVPHKILVTGETVVFRPTDYLFNQEEDYLFYLCDETGSVLSRASVAPFRTGHDTGQYFRISRKIDLETYRRRLYILFRDYSRENWDIISSLLDKFILNETSLYQSFTDFLLTEVLTLPQAPTDLLVRLILWEQQQRYLPTDRSFLKEQVYAEGYHKHLFPESKEPYIICRTRLQDGQWVRDHILAGETATELFIDQEKFVYFYGISCNLSRTSAFVMYHNIHSGPTRYFYFPGLEVTVAHGLY